MSINLLSMYRYYFLVLFLFSACTQQYNIPRDITQPTTLNNNSVIDTPKNLDHINILESINSNTSQNIEIRENSENYESHYIKKDNDVYYSDNDEMKKIDGGDVATFQILGPIWENGPMIAKDNNNVYFDNQLFFYDTPEGRKTDLDPQTFTIISPQVVKDKDHVLYLSYGWFEEVEADVSTFEYIGDIYYRDRDHIYFEKKLWEGSRLAILDTADTTTFHSLGYFYAVDRNHVFGEFTLIHNGFSEFHVNSIEGVDPSTVRVLSENTFEDQYALYKKEIFDCEEFECERYIKVSEKR